MENNTSDRQEMNLKYLGFVRAAAINTIVWLSNVYDYAKHNSGPLRSAVGAVEGAVTTVVSPVYDKFKDVPDHFLVFLDHKVDAASAKFDEHAPPLAKKALVKTTKLAKDIAHEAQVGGPFAAARYAVKELTELVLDQFVKVWSKLDQLPPFHKVAELTVPTAAHWSDRYNKLVTDMRGKGYSLFSYIPLVPSDDIAKAFKQYNATNEGDILNQPAAEVSSQ